MADAFLLPSNATHRQYEALRAFFVDNVPSALTAERFGYTPGSFRVLCHEFRRNPGREFFLPPTKKAKSPPLRERVRQMIITLRKQNSSVYDIRDALVQSGEKLSAASISTILKEEGFARLPRRRDDERPATTRPDAADVADARALDLSERTFRTKVGGLFLFLPYLARIPLESMLAEAKFPGTKMMPAAHAIRSLLAMKLFGSARHSHVMSYVFDEGLALFAGLNVIPKRSFLTEYSCRIEPDCYPRIMQSWFDAVKKLGLKRGGSLDLDFHTIPFHGEDALMQKHYISKRSRKQKGVLAFVAQDSETRVFCYANGDLRKEQQNDEILKFVEFWKERTGRLPQELVFDSKLTTYANLNELNKMGIDFITLRRRSDTLLEELRQASGSAWRQIHLSNVSRAFRTPKVLETKIRLSDYEGPIRQLAVRDLGHDKPTLLLTNQLRRSPTKLIDRYAQRMLIENGIADGIDFFHMDALSSAVAMKVNCDLQLTLMASSLYRLLGAEIGKEYTDAKSRRIFRDFIDATAVVTIDQSAITIQFQKRAHNPYLLKAGFDRKRTRIPWLGGRRLQFVFG
ncbi:MAG: transposase [Verrucomicrobia bacterium]|nr:transposase [Verrucomicrobiota bacterium]